MSLVTLSEHININHIAGDEGVFLFNDKVSETSYLPAPYSLIVKYIQKMSTVSIDDLKLFAEANNKLLDTIISNVDNVILELKQQKIVKISD